MDLNRRDTEYNSSHFKLPIYNRNAANLLASYSIKFNKRLLYYYSDGKGNYSPSPFLTQLIRAARSMKKAPRFGQKVFLGHFQRIFYNCARSLRENFFDTFYKLAPDLCPFYSVLIPNINIICIKELFTALSSDYPKEFSNSNDPSIIFKELAKFGATKSAQIQPNQDYLSSISIVKNFSQVFASVQIIHDVIEDYYENTSYVRNNEVIESLLIIGKNVPESSFIVPFCYKLIFQIATFENASLSDFDEIFNRVEFFPEISRFYDIKKRIENYKISNEIQFTGQRLICQIPIFFSKLPNEIYDLFFIKDKYEDSFDEQFVYTIKNVLSKKEKLNFSQKITIDIYKSYVNHYQNHPNQMMN